MAGHMCVSGFTMAGSVLNVTLTDLVSCHQHTTVLHHEMSKPFNSSIADLFVLRLLETCSSDVQSIFDPRGLQKLLENRKLQLPAAGIQANCLLQQHCKAG